MAAPTHNGEAPLTVPAFTFGFMVTAFDADAGPLHPLTVYMILAVPALTPVTDPELASTEAIPGALLLQVPPGLPLLEKVEVAPMHKAAAPLNVPAFTFGLTVTACEDTPVPLHPLME